MIEVKNLTKMYGPHLAIDTLNFQVKKGEVVGFLGPNGAGKSTTMKIITGFMAPTTGQASVAGYDVFENPIDVKRRIGYLPETPPVYGEMYVKDYLKFVAQLKGVEKNRIAGLVDIAVEKTNLGDVQYRLIQNLSKGFKQRVGIAQALVSDPEVLILDEPTVGLDPKQVAEIRDLIKDLRVHHTVILSTHILSEVQAICEKIIIIHNGKIVAENSLADLSASMKGGSRVILRVKRPVLNMTEVLHGIAGVRGVESVGGEWRLQTEGDDSVLERISTHVVQNNLGLIQLSAEALNLEEIFLKLTYDKDGVQ